MIDTKNTAEKISHIGVYISDQSVEVAEILSGEAGSYSVRQTASTDLDSGIVEHGKVIDSDLLVEILRRLWSPPNNFSKKEVCFVMPDEASYFHTFAFPGSLSDTEVQSAVRFQFEEVFPLSYANAVSNFGVVARSVEETIVTCAAVNKENVLKFEEVFSKAGLKCVGIGLEAQALRRVILDPPKQSTSPWQNKKAILVAYFRENKILLFIINSYGLYSSFTFKLDASNKALPKIKTFVAGEISKIAAWYESATLAKLEELIIFGNVHDMDDIAEALKNLLKDNLSYLNIRVSDFASRMESEHAFKIKDKEKNAPLFIAPVGGALRGLAPETHTFEFLESAQKNQRFAKSENVASAPRKYWSLEDFRLYMETVPERTKIIISVIFISLTVIGLVGAFIRYSISAKKAERDSVELRAALMREVTTTPTVKTPKSK